jgi:colanic acid/amylovoran biosynthesis protein
MNILIVNQPSANRGDESAHRSLLRSLVRQWPNANIEVLFVRQSKESTLPMQVDAPNVHYVSLQKMTKGLRHFARIGLKYHLLAVLLKAHPAIAAIARYIKNADIIVNAPGGICMGGFQDWMHIFMLCIAMHYQKKIVYYSRSFGPFPTKTKDNVIFKKISYKLLRYFDFLSIRDAQTMHLADTLQLNYVPSIDTALLDSPTTALPEEIKLSINTDNYVVFVPNKLVWHPAYHAANADKIADFYIGIAKFLSDKFPDYKIVLLPQLFGAGERGDVNYFYELKQKFNAINVNNVVVLPEHFGSDVQQTVIAKARLVIGARYHSIVFAINQAVPFVALSYEHKIQGLCEILKLSQRTVDISALGTPAFDAQKALQEVQQIVALSSDGIVESKKRANDIANNCFMEFCKRFNCPENNGGF